ncbi:MAG: aminotransferase class I/II-fold pyridoxal phosphate-dependent enzyme [Alphaproteobacteria bacterium]|nr:aminotransferase class I/II-fold pyridoxal phosphate-dependent enzyme [Alphaproteobacteria bacterium]
MTLYAKFADLAGRYRALNAAGHNPFQVNVDQILSPTEAMVNGRRTLMVGTNNYLGLTFDPDSIAAAEAALREEGTGTTGSRIANGSYGAHRRLEGEIATYYDRRHCMVFSTGYQVNLGLISTLAGPNDHVIIDADSHASIYDGCRLGGAKITRFKHNDAADLDRRLARLPQDGASCLIIVEGIYSMLGDIAPLREIVAVKRRHGAYLMVDEAHSMGVLGRTGRGLAEEADVEADVDFIVGTFSKSLGAVGGYCVSDHDEFELLRVACRSYMFTASLPPSIMASVSQALRTLQRRPELRTRLMANARALHGGLAGLGFSVGPQVTPVVAVQIDEVETAIRFWNALLDSSVYVNMALPPATPNGVALMRCSVSAAHSRKQIGTIIGVFEDVGRTVGVLPERARRAVAR